MASGTYKFVNAEDIADGSGEYNLDDETNTHILEHAISGMGPPPIEVSVDRRARRTGVQIRAAHMPARQVLIPVLIQDTTHDNLRDRIRALSKYFLGSLGRETPRFGQLRVTPASETEKYLRCICVDAPNAYRLHETATIQRVDLLFVADHPNWYNPTEQSQAITIGSGSGTQWPLRFPVQWGLDGFSGGATVVNNGDAETRSVLWSVPGPFSAPALFNETVGQYVSLPTLEVNAGETLKVRMGWRPDGIAEHKAVVENAQGSETSVMGHLDQTSEFFHLTPGNNVMTATQAEDTATVHAVYWYDEYVSI